MMDVEDRSTAEALLSLLGWERYDDGVPGNSTSQFNMVKEVEVRTSPGYFDRVDIVTRIILAENIFYIQVDDSDRGKQSTGPLSYSRFSTLFPRYREEHEQRIGRAQARRYSPRTGNETT